MAKKVNIGKVKHFIKGHLRKQLKQDLLKLRIVREADLASCVYFHLRTFLRADKTWRVLVNRLSYLTGHFIDVVIFREKKKAGKKQQIPRIAMELKWNKQRISKKDRSSLDKCIEKLGVEKAYFISALTDNKKFQRIEKTKTEKIRLIEIAIYLGLAGPALEEWKTARRLFTRNMSLGKRGIPRKATRIV